jgi:signal transduction histidine kinase
MQLKTKLILMVGLVIGISYGVTFYRTSNFQEKLVVEQATRQAKMLFNQIRLTRRWIADHNGLFLAKEPGVASNPFLDQGEIQDAEGNWLVKRNPAMVTRELSLYAAEQGMGQFNVTSLKPINPANAPDAFERRSLQKFNQGVAEAVEIDQAGGSYRLRYMAPLQVDERCLACHGKQGYQVGDIRGGMNVTIPIDWAFANIHHNNRMLLWIALSTIVAVSLSLYILFSQLVGRRLKHLARAMKNYPDQPLDKDFSAQEPADEIGLLSHRFQQLCDRLDSSQEELDNTRKQVFRNEKQAALGRLVAGIAHEINNPLGGMQNCIQTMQRNPDQPDLQARYLNLLAQGIGRIKGTVQQLLNIGRHEPLETSTGDIDDMIRECLELTCAGQQNIRLEPQLNIRQPVTTGIEALRQVILNLASNAVQALGPQPGTISVTSCVAQQTLYISLCDSGPGIASEHLEHIFEPFYTTKGVGEGTGLGLSISHSLIVQLGGTIEVSNRPSGGACFTISLPLKSNAATPENL